MPHLLVKHAKRYFCWTVNNPTADDDKQLVDLTSNDNVRYLCYGRENAGTPHYQGYVEFLKPQRFSWFKKRLTRAHIEPKKGSRTQARDYCFKEDSSPFEYGTWVPDRQGQRNDLMTIKHLLDDQECDIDDVEDNHFPLFCRHARYFRDYYSRRQPPRDWKTKVLVFHGATATGKTQAAFQMPNSGQCDWANSFIEGYKNQRVVIFDDVKNPCKLFGRRLFLRLTDRYPMKINVKYGTQEWNPSIIIFTTNDNPANWDLDPACARRIDEFVDFDTPKQPPLKMWNFQ